MIIIRLMGGLGNQLQQYALYEKLISMGKQCALDLSWFESATQEGMAAKRECELKSFTGADFCEASPEQIYSLIGDGSTVSRAAKKIAGLISSKPWETGGRRRCVCGIKGNSYFAESGMYHPEVFRMDDVYLEGYWAAEKYYADILPRLKDKLAFDISGMNPECRAVADLIKQTGMNPGSNAAGSMAELSAGGQFGEKTKTCAVHIRRGDYLDPINASVFGGIATEDYYDAAFAYVRESFPDTKFFIFSDDPEYVRERYGGDASCIAVNVNHGRDSRYDIYLMSLCDMHICANSTFSFWGVRLSEGHDPEAEGTGNGAEINIRPTIQKNSQKFEPELMRDLWKGWTFIDPQGNVRRV